MNPLRLPLALGVLVLGLAPLACDSREARPFRGTFDLAQRKPDAVLEQPGVFVPDPEHEWKGFGLRGWNKVVGTTEAGLSYLVMIQAEAELNLPAVSERDRTIALSLWCATPIESTPQPLVVRLNGVLARESIEPTREPLEFEVHMPAEAWNIGDNVLELATQRTARGWDEIRVARVSYDEPSAQAFDPATGRWSLVPGASLRYFVETVHPARLRLVGEARGGGTLLLELGRMDPATGDLEPGTGQELALTLRKRPIDHVFELPDPQGLVTSIGVGFRGEGGSSFVLERLEIEDGEPTERPPIVFISIDTFAARHLKLYGYAHETTPNLSALAQDSVVFDRCVANAPWTMPSYLSVLTGLYPSAHNRPLEQGSSVDFSNWDYWEIADSRWTIAEMLRARGYDTAAWIDTDWLLEKFRTEQGFDRFDAEAVQYSFDTWWGGIAMIERRIAEWFAGRRRADPPFLFVHALDAHGPYKPDVAEQPFMGIPVPESPFRGTFARELEGKPTRKAPAGSMYQTFGAIPVWMAMTLVAIDAIPDVMEVEPIVAAYDEAILKTDFYLGRLFGELKQRGLYDDAVIVVTGDHGESFAHDFYSHSGMWEDIVHVPLLLKLPRNVHGGTRVAQSVQLVDVYPTLAELSGAGSGKGWLHGRSLLPLASGSAGGASAAKGMARPTFSEGGYVKQFMIEEAGWKLVEVFPGEGSGEAPLLTHPRVPREWLEKNLPELVGRPLTDALYGKLRGGADFGRKIAELRELVRGPYYELYDLAADPRELVDLAAREPARVERLRGLLEEAKSRGLEAQARAKPNVFVRRMSPEESKRLGDMGYVVGEENPSKK